MTGVGLCNGHEEVYPSGPIHGVANSAIKRIVRGNFCFPKRRIAVVIHRQRGRHSTGWSAVIIVTGDDAHVRRHRRIAHGGVVKIGLPVLVFRQHDFCRSHVAGRQSGVKARDKIMNLLRGPQAGFVIGPNIGLVLDGDGVEVDAVIALHVDHVTGQLTGISLVAGREKISAVDICYCF